MNTSVVYFNMMRDNGEMWAEELSTRTYNLSLESVSPIGKRIRLFTDDKKRGVYLRVVDLPSSRWSVLGKAGYFYSNGGELPEFKLEDEFKHLADNIYCYTIAYP